MTRRDPRVDAIADGLRHGHITRRQALGRLGAAGLSLSAATAVLAACGSDNTGSGPAATSTTNTSVSDEIATRAIEGAAALGLKGKTIRIFHPTGMESNFEPFAEEWRKATGIEVKGLSVGYFDFHPKVVQASIGGGANFDLVADGPRYIGDLVAAGALVDIGEWIEKYGNVLSGAPEGYIPPLDKWSMSYKGKYYGLCADGDPFMCLVRRDLLEDPKEQKAFASKYGYDLEFPKTWTQYRDQAEFFTRPPKLYGAVDVHARKSGAYQWLVRFVSKDLPNMYFFDDEMRPLIDSDQGVATTEEYLALKPFMNPDISNWDFTQQYPSWGNGDAYEVNYVVSLAKFSEGEDSRVKGKVISGLMPGTEVDGKVNHRSMLAYGNTYMVWGKSELKEAAYLFAQWITSPSMSARTLEQPGFCDPYRLADLKSPSVRKVYGSATMDAYAENMARQVPDLQLEGVAEYYEALDANLSAAWAGNKSPEQVVKDTAATWERITERVGRESQVEQWRELKKAWPDA